MLCAWECSAVRGKGHNSQYKLLWSKGSQHAANWNSSFFPKLSCSGRASERVESWAEIDTDGGVEGEFSELGWKSREGRPWLRGDGGRQAVACAEVRLCMCMERCLYRRQRYGRRLEEEREQQFKVLLVQWPVGGGLLNCTALVGRRGSVGRLPTSMVALRHGLTLLGPQRSPHPCSSGLLDRPCQASTQA